MFCLHPTSSKIESGAADTEKNTNLFFFQNLEVSLNPGLDPVSTRCINVRVSTCTTLPVFTT